MVALELTRGRALLVFLVFAAAAFAVYRGALDAPFVSDDRLYLEQNPHRTLAHAGAMLDPFGAPAVFTLNYAPVHLLAHGAELAAFGDDVRGYHVVNVLLHAGNAVLLAVLLGASGVPGPAALLGAGFFLLHPANVEAVAWISQLKSTGALAFALGALLLLPRRPALATLLFALGLLTKPLAAFALPMAAGLAWARRDGAAGDGPLGLGVWLALWTALLVGYTGLEWTAGYTLGSVEAHPDSWVRVRSSAAIGARYLAMAATSYGVSAFHETPRALFWTDRWWLLALPLGAGLAWRALWTLSRRRPEGAYWLGAAAAFAPVSQVVPFVHPMADRYLYFMLPGLIGGALHFGLDLGRRLPSERARTWLARGCAVACGVCLVVFAVRSGERATLWQGDERLLQDSARRYPEGRLAYWLRGRALAEAGDPAAVDALARAAWLFSARFRDYQSDPALEPIRDTPRFQALVRELARRHAEEGRRRNLTHPWWLRSRGLAHATLGEFDEAMALLEASVRAGGPTRDAALLELELVRAERMKAERSERERGARR